MTAVVCFFKNMGAVIECTLTVHEIPGSYKETVAREFL